MIITFKDPVTSIGPALALIIASIPETYSTIAQYSEAGHPGKLPAQSYWRDLMGRLGARVDREQGIAQSLITCDSTVNTPTLVQENRIAVKVFVKMSGSTVTDSAHVAMRRVSVGVVEIEIRG